MELWKNNLSPIVTQNSHTGMFEMSKSKKISGSLRSSEEYQILIVFTCWHVMLEFTFILVLLLH